MSSICPIRSQITLLSFASIFFLSLALNDGLKGECYLQEGNESQPKDQIEAKIEDADQETATDDKDREDALQSSAQTSSNESDANLLQNASLEEADGDVPRHWYFPASHSKQGVKHSQDQENANDGQSCWLVDATEMDTSKISFTMLNQIIDPENLKGKRVRFKAAVRTDATDNGGKAQLWFRVDRVTKDGKREMGAFDNMGNRPITSSQWQHYEIVADVDEDADRLTVGMLVIGNAKAWIDDASLEIVNEDQKEATKVTGMRNIGDDSPVQPFFNGWLWLAALAIGLMLYSQQPNNYAQRFALRFTLVYMVLYSFPTLISGIIGSILGLLGKFGTPVEQSSNWLGEMVAWHKQHTETAVHWTAENVFGITGQLVLPNGSGDTTFAFIRVFACCMIALAVAFVWTGIYWRRADQTWLRDFLRTYLRYIVALTMLGYGLHKTGFEMTQFAQDSMPREFQLDRTYGDSSPMGLLWTFMAASPAYTFFAGLGEVIGGLLLIFRRTATVGALVIIGVMTNVVMLNFCYDVPVKQYSFHLLLMALIVALPDVPRLFKVLVLNQATEPGNLLTRPYTNSYTNWFFQIIKVIVVLCAFAWPVGETVFKEVKHYQTNAQRQRQEQTESEHLLINRGFRWINEYPYNR